VATAHTRIGQEPHGARIGRQVAGLVALDGVASDADLLAELIFNCRGRAALTVGDAANTGFQQAAKQIAASRHSGALAGAAAR
jgi:hypothetical protein